MIYNDFMQAIDFLKQVRVELEKVVWPSRKETIELTILVIFITILVGFFIGGIDYLLTEATRLILR